MNGKVVNSLPLNEGPVAGSDSRGNEEKHLPEKRFLEKKDSLGRGIEQRAYITFKYCKSSETCFIPLQIYMAYLKTPLQFQNAEC